MNRFVPALLPVLFLAACGGKKPAPEATEAPPVNIAADNIAIADTQLVERGPSLSGSLTAERSAQLRAQVSGTVAVYVEEGSVVSSGQLVAMIDTIALGDAARSARSQLLSAQLASDVAKRNYERSQTLHAAGAIADRDLETAHNQSVASDAMLADAKSRVTGADRQLANAKVHSPFAGVVSERPASSGDVVQMGSPLMTVVDPSQLQLEASVPSDQLSQIKSGAKVEFAVSGISGKSFTGRVARINPSVDPTTRQVKLYVSVPNPGHTLVAGAFAEGRVAVTSMRALTVPLSAIDSKAAIVSVKRLRNGLIESIPVTLGVRDDVAERVEITKGIAAGDTVLIGASLGTPAGARVRVANANR